MARIDKSEVKGHLAHLGRNSSHYVWLLADLTFFKSSHDWIFGFYKRGRVTLIALEPLTRKYDSLAFESAWKEFVQSEHPEVVAFVGVGEEFAHLLESCGFKCIIVGKEPWVELEHCIPRGNSGKGVRAARNKALRSGLRVEEWPAAEIFESPEKQRQLGEICEQWKSGHLVDLQGFLNAVDPFARIPGRRYFILRAADLIHAFLVATPVPARGSYFLEDTIIRPDAPAGSGELLTLEAMVSLRDSGVKEASLGVVSGVELRARVSAPPLEFVFKAARRIFACFYNFEGLELYRRRFKPHRWPRVYLAARTEPDSALSLWNWVQVLWTLLNAFSPKLALSPSFVVRATKNCVSKHPFSVSLAALICALYMRNGLSLAEPVLSHAAPLQRLWISFAANFLFVRPVDYYFLGPAYLFLVIWTESNQRRRDLGVFFALLYALQTIFNHLIFYHVPDAPLYKHLLFQKNFGVSFTCAALLGLQLFQFRRLREPLFALSVLGMLILAILTSHEMRIFALDMAYPVFFVFGFLWGKFQLERERQLSRLVAKLKPPAGRSVLQRGKISSRP